MSESEQEPQPSGMNLNDVLFMLFKHKWKLLFCAIIGIAAAVAIFLLSPSVYESQAKLLVRYVVDKSAVDAIDGQVKTPNSQSLNLINSEVEILTSWDLATQVAEAIGVGRLAASKPGALPDKTEAARNIIRGLNVTALKDTNIIVATYRNANPELAVRVLQELVTRYFDKHLEVHRSVGAFDFVTRETNQVRTQLNQTEEELKRLKAKAGVISLPETTASLNAELAKSQEDLNAAEAELAGQQARVKEIERYMAGADATQMESASHRPSNDALQDYQSLVNHVAHLRETEMSLLSRYTPENRIVKLTQSQIADLENQRRAMEQRFPGLAAAATVTGSAQNGRPDLISEKARLVSIEAQANTLRSRIAVLEDQAKVLSELGPQIAELQRRRDVEEANYKYFEASLDKARIDETLDPSRMPNISVVQKPSAAQKATRDVKKVVLGLAGGGIGFGIAIAVLIEMVLDRTVKRPLELETRLRIPVLLSIPYFGRNGQLHLRANNSDPDADGFNDGDPSSLDPWEDNHFIRPFCEALRDRLIFDFELSKMAHKPKLVAVTSCTDGAGASTIAVGVATALSETCDGKVLLVDKQFDPRRFYDLIAEFKASDFDYIIFDMPSLTNGAATLAMAGLMDKVLLVVEAEKSNRDTVKRAYAKLAAAQAKVVTVFNKTRSYGPKWLESEV
ncbi:MAG: hypothetical protein JOY92_14750 [Verrucomicrobia bacterium]|nr:hypothetical protein [Verrucomicrobiota bacterium]